MALDSTTIQLIQLALDEDIGSGDITTLATVAAEATAAASIVQRAPGCIFGHEVAQAVFAEVDPRTTYEPVAIEGEWRDEGVVALVSGPARAILTAERVALNFIGHLSGVATASARAVHAVEGTGAKILDTRKTAPGMRSLEKAAVRAGGAMNHRVGLYDAMLIKENHIAAAGGIGSAMQQATEYAQAASAMVEVEVECCSLAEVDAALAAGATRLLLDNFTTAELVAAAQLVAGRAELEASGGYTLQNVREAADTGVGYVSLGSITHSAAVLDLSLLFESRYLLPATIMG